MATLDVESYYPEPEPPLSSRYMYFEAAEANSTVAFKSTKLTAPNLEYSFDGETWQEWQHTTHEESYDSGSTTLHAYDAIPLSNIGDKVYLKGVNPEGFRGEGYLDGNGFGVLILTGKLYCHGNAQSIVDGDEPSLVAKTMPTFYDYGLSNNQTTVLLSAPELPATTLADGCYGGMFANCTSLTQAPELPATTLADGCYRGMFESCTSLTEAPERLPATTLASECYDSMFRGCTSLTQAPELPATALAENCYSGMFANCTSLTQAPELPATTLADGCYRGMFESCTSLTEAPERLPATTLAESCYSGMFANCTSLTQAPVLPAKTLVGVDYDMYSTGCYQYMFYNCTSLTSVTCLAETMTTAGCTEGWLYNVSPTGTFTKSPNMSSWTTGNNGIPSGWTVQDYTE